MLTPRDVPLELGEETLSIDLTCTNRHLPAELRVGDISVPTPNSPTIARFRNLTGVTTPSPPPLGSELHWRLVAHLALNQRSLADPGALKSLCALYNFHSTNRQQGRANELRATSIRERRDRADAARARASRAARPAHARRGRRDAVRRHGRRVRVRLRARQLVRRTGPDQLVQPTRARPASERDGVHMAAEEREPADPLKLAEALLANASRADFFSLVPLLERLSPNATRIGGDGPPNKEALRFRHDPSMGFSAGDIAAGALAYVRDDATDPLSRKHAVMRLTTTFLGLTGSVSPLPLYIPAEIAHNHDGENLQANFLDIFHHRLLSLFYRLWTRYQYAREFTSNADDVWSRRVLALAAPTSETARARSASRATSCSSSRRCWRRARARRAGSSWRSKKCSICRRGTRVSRSSSAATRRSTKTSACACRRRPRSWAAAPCSARWRTSAAIAFASALGPMSASEYPHYIRRGERVELVREVVNLMVREPLDYDLELLLRDDALPGFLISARRGMTLGVTTRLRAAGGQQSVMVRNVGRRAQARRHDSTHRTRGTFHAR